MTDDYTIADEAPRDEAGHPTHPERGHRICAGTKSERTTPTKHGRERDDYDYCLLAAGWGVEDKNEGPCKHHLGAVDNRGDRNGNYKHGAFSEHLMSDLSDRERESYQDLVEQLTDPETAIGAIRQQTAEAYLKYKRSGDTRFLREYRQLADTFNLAPNADHFEHSGDGFKLTIGSPVEDDDD